MANADTEACLWVRTDYTSPVRKAREFDPAKGRMTVVLDENGDAVLERVPPRGYVGNDIKSMRLMTLPRSMKVLKHDGNEVELVTSNAAGNPQQAGWLLDDRQKKCRVFSWFRADRCPVREIYAGHSRKFVKTAAIKAPGAVPCSEHDVGHDDEGRPLPPCPHYLAERAARRAAQAARNAAENEKFRDKDEAKTEVLAGLVTSQQQLTAALVANMTKPEPAPDPDPKLAHVEAPTEPSGKRK